MGLKLIVKSVLRRLGFGIYRLPPRQDKSGVVPVQIGPYRIMIYAISPLHRLLTENPDYSGELRRIVSLAIKKYPDLAVIDVGANCGDTAAIVKMAADVPVFCIEGDPRAYELLEQNLRQFSGVTARNVLLGERVEEIPVVFEKEGWNLTVVPQEGPSSTTISLTTLDECVRSLEDADCYRVLKVDTEGFDCRIIRGGMSYIERVRPIIMMEYNRQNMDRIGEPGFNTLLRLRDVGYRDIFYYDDGGRLVLATTLDEEELIRDLHEYANGHDGSIYYFDLCLFHATDADLAEKFTRSERARRHG